MFSFILLFFSSSIPSTYCRSHAKIGDAVPPECLRQKLMNNWIKRRNGSWWDAMCLMSDTCNVHIYVMRRIHFDTIKWMIRVQTPSISNSQFARDRFYIPHGIVRTQNTFNGWHLLGISAPTLESLRLTIVRELLTSLSVSWSWIHFVSLLSVVVTCT